MGRLQGKIVVVTAAGQGTGLASAFACAREGARVTVTNVDETKVVTHAAVNNITAERLTCSIPLPSRPSRPGTGVPKRSSCVGFLHNGTILDCDEQSFFLSLDLKVRAMYRMVRAFLPAPSESAAEAR